MLATGVPCPSDGEEGLPFRKPEPCPWMCRAGSSGVSCLTIMLLLDFTEKLKQLNELGKYLEHAVPREKALNGPLPDVVAEVLPLVHEQQDQGQNSVTTEVGPEVGGQSLGDEGRLTRAGTPHCSDHIHILQYGPPNTGGLAAGAADPITASLPGWHANLVPSQTWTVAPCPIAGLVTGCEAAASLSVVVYPRLGQGFIYTP